MRRDELAASQRYFTQALKLFEKDLSGRSHLIEVRTTDRLLHNHCAAVGRVYESIYERCGPEHVRRKRDRLTQRARSFAPERREHDARQSAGGGQVLRGGRRMMSSSPASYRATATDGHR
jgi:hypothetical protein